ncbi:MAG: glycosyltransferase [Pirellulales bacterium]|nr:glycosyltransferase [Pirellulales bacterium]
MALRMGEHLPADQYRVSYLCLDELGTWGTELRAVGGHVHLLGRRPGLDWRCARRLGAHLRREGIDLVHAHQYTPFFYVVAARHFHRRPPILFTEHGRWFPDFPRPKRMLFNRLFMGSRDRAVGVGEAVRRALVDNEGLPPDRVSVIYNGVDLAPYRACLSDRQGIRTRVRADLGVSESELVLAQIARLDDLKDHATAVRAMSRIAAAVPSSLLLIVGDGPERAIIQKLIGELGVGRNVRLIGTRCDVPEILQAADLFLLSSKSEGIPLTVIEAMAAKLPVVATDVGGLSEIVVPGVTGWLMPAGNDAALAAAAIELLQNASQRAAFGEQGFARACERFDENRMHREYQALYAELLA